MNIFSWFKTLGLLTLLISLNIIKADPVKTEKLNVLATALFYTDAKGQALLITGPLSNQTEKIIHLQVKGLVQPENLQDIRVVSLLKNLTKTSPSVPDELLNILRKEHPEISGTVFKLKLNATDSRRIFHDMRRDTKTTTKAAKSNKKSKTPAKGKPTEKPKTVVATVETPDESSTHASESSEEMSDESIPVDTDFVPNDIFFTVEKKCANWKLDCGVKNDWERHGSYLGMHENALPIANWLP